ncbi:acyl carrier protein [Silvibacterium bohemicum]|uniref:Acyl carrier protein n=1 Tax=Silvibacterium bohemicum TaxID=1577686 RepID=A0A841K1P6_9BACT|nr:acyl carrier protein [Silvibacterium bohemicum]MBB6144154.1 acyl carrier protein [Silvibacterium bohemicum]
MADLTADSVLAGLQPIFEDVLDEPGIEITRDSNALNTPNWDSLAHIEILETVQRRFKVKFGLMELQKLKTVGDLVDLVLEKSQPAN